MKDYKDEEFLASKSLSDEDAAKVYAIAIYIVMALDDNRIKPSELVITALELMINRLKQDLRQ